MRMRFALFRGIRPLTRDGAVRDVLAGVTLASMNIPQVLGYARIAGMPVVTGLYTVLLPVVAFAVFGASRHLVVAADSATAAIVSGSLGHMAAPSSAAYIALVGMVALLTAGLLLVARIFRLGFLADFLSRTVLVGFLTGVGIQVGIAMLGDMLGLIIDAHRAPQQLWQIMVSLRLVSVPTLALSAAIAAVILAGRRIVPHWPVSLFAVVASIAASYALDFAGHGIGTIGAVPGGLPSLHLPRASWDQLLMLLPVVTSCFVVIVAQSAATSRVFALRFAERDDADADILGLAAANAAAALTGTFVVNGSPTQTAMAERAGARGQIAQLGFAATVALVLLFATGALQYLPRCVLAAIVFTIAIGMIDLAGMRAIRRESPGEFILAGITTAAVAGIGVEQGILVAIALSLLRHVRHSYRAHALVLVPGENDQWNPLPARPGLQTEPGLIIYRFAADLFYANIGHFADDVRALVAGAPSPVRSLVIEAAAITDIDYSAAQSLRDLLEELRRQGVRTFFGRVSPYLLADMERHRIGGAACFPSLHQAIAAARAPGP